MPRTRVVRKRRAQHRRKPSTMRRRTRRRFHKTGIELIRCKTISGIPDRYFAKHRYVDYNTTNISIIGGATGHYGTTLAWALNTIAHPGPNDAGNHPFIPGTNELGALFGTFRVRACKYRIQFSNTDSLPCFVGCCAFQSQDPNATGDLNPITDFTTYIKCREAINGNKWAQGRVLGPISGNQGVVTLKGYINMEALEGNPALYRINADYDGYTPLAVDSSSNWTDPTKLSRLCVYALPYDVGTSHEGDTESVSVVIEVRMEFYVDYYNKSAPTD